MAAFATDEKSNEITAIPALLKLADVRGAIVTMGTQTAIALDIVAGGADFVLALKGNQEKLSQAVVTHIDEQMQTDFADCGAHRLVTAEQSHGRKEQRPERTTDRDSNAGSQNAARVQPVVRPQDDRRRDADASARRSRNLRLALFYQQPRHGE